MIDFLLFMMAEELQKKLPDTLLGHIITSERVCTCERDPDSLVEALQPLVTLTGAVRQEEVRAWAGQHVSVTCRHKQGWT